MSNTNRDRQARFAIAMADKGFAKAQGWVPAGQRADIQLMMKLLAENPGLEPGPLRDTRTGKLVKWRS